MNFKYIVLTILFFSWAEAGIIPSTTSSLGLNDAYANYQWGLHSDGQIILRDRTDIESEKVSQTPTRNPDVSVDPVAVTVRMKKTILIAVMDSGIDMTHPDLKDVIFKNESECDQGKIPFKPEKDNDQNGYKGDCSGWNFTVPDDSNLANNPDDDLGHGTHVSGIIAASIQNKIGISGALGNVKILPLKVTSAMDNSGALSGKASVLLTSRILKAMDYAIRMKVDVINLSMGWPLATDNDNVRAVFARAQAQGITIVAAAGNNNNSSFNFPCSYPGVICVAAHGIDQKLTSFSNFGGQVDLSAPGEEILSTYPMTTIPMLFSVKGYELLNGTSQAAPYVSAGVAALKGVYPGISEDVIKARLFISAQKLLDADKKFISFGGVKISQALDLKETALVVPDLKNLSEIKFNYPNDKVSFKLDLKNLWIQQKNVQVEVRSLSRSLNLNLKSSPIALNPSQALTLFIDGRISDFKLSREVQILVSVKTDDGVVREFRHVFNLVRDLDNDNEIVDLPFRSQYNLNSSLVQNSLLTVYDPLGVASVPSYYWTEMTNGSLQFHLVKIANNAAQEKSLALPNGSLNLLNITFVPTNNTSVYWVGTLGLSADKKRTLQYQVFDSDGGLVKQYLFMPETVVLDKDAVTSLHFLDKSKQDFMPVFITQGKIPLADLSKDSFDFEVNNAEKRVFYLEPVQEGGGLQWSYKTRVFDNLALKTQLRNQLGLSYQDDLNLFGMLPQRWGDQELHIVYTAGPHATQQFVILDVTAQELLSRKFRIRRTNISSAFLPQSIMESVVKLEGNQVIKNSRASLGFFLTPIKSENHFLSEDGLQDEVRLDLESSTPKDLLISYIQSFQAKAGFVTFAQSKSNLILQVQDRFGRIVRSEESVHRATWPGLSFSELFYPAALHSGGEFTPALYVDATQLYSKNIYFWTLNEANELVAPMYLNYAIPSRCRALTPQMFRVGVTEFRNVLVCMDSQQKLVLKTISLQ